MSSPLSGDERRFLTLTALLFAALVLAVFYPVLRGEIPLPAELVTQFSAWDGVRPHRTLQPVAQLGDLVDEIYPFNAFAASQIRHGILPRLNPNAMSGVPVLAEPQNALFYPLHALYYLFSTPTAWTLAILIRAWLAGFFMTFWMRSIGANRAGSIFAGVAFAIGGFSLGWQAWPMGDTLIWLPLICYGVHRLHVDRSLRSAAFMAFVFAMTVLAGHPETAIHLVLTGSAGALLIWAFPLHGRSRFSMRFLLLFGIAGLIAIGLTSVQTLPTAEWIQQSGRMEDVWPSLPLHQALGFFSRDTLRGPNSAGIWVPNAVEYTGMVTLLLAAIGLLHSTRRFVVWFVVLSAFGFAATYGIEPVRWVLLHIPVIKNLKNERLFLLANFGIAALAGLGITVLDEDAMAQSKARRLLGWLLVGASFIGAMWCVHVLQLSTHFKVEAMRRPSFSRTLLLISAVLIGWKLVRGQRAWRFSVFACALLIFDLGTFAFGYTGYARRVDIFPPAPVFDFLRQQGPPGTFRVGETIPGSYPANSPTSYGVQSLTGYEAIVPETLHRFILDFSDSDEDAIHLIGEKTATLRDRRIDLLNLKYIVVTVGAPEYQSFRDHAERFLEVFKQGNLAVFENKTVLPRAFLVRASNVRVIPEGTAQLELLKNPGFNPLKNVVLYEKAPGPVEPETSNPFSIIDPAEVGRAEILESDVNGYHLRLQAASPAILVISQNFYRGWKAVVDGVPAAVFQADYAVIGVAVPAGNHDVQVVFDPASFKIGAAISILSVFILIGMIVKKEPPVGRGEGNL